MAIQTTLDARMLASIASLTLATTSDLVGRVVLILLELMLARQVRRPETELVERAARGG